MQQLHTILVWNQIQGKKGVFIRNIFQGPLGTVKW